MNVREAHSEERLTVRSIFDVAMLDVPNLLACELLVAVEEGRVLGAAAIEAEGLGGLGELHAIAVRPRRRGQGIGTALVREAEARWDPVTAEFDARVRPFYERLEFSIEAVGDGRYRGKKRTAAGAQN